MDINFVNTEKPVIVSQVSVKGTILNYCVDIPYKNVKGMMTEESRKKFENDENLTIDVVILDTKDDTKVLMHKETTCLFYQNNKMRINLPADFHAKLQQIFWFSSAIYTCKNSSQYFKKMDESLQETCQIIVYSNERKLSGHQFNSIVFRPTKVVKMEDIKQLPSEKQMLVDMAFSISQSGLFILNTKNMNGEKSLPENEVIYASKWKKVSEFEKEPERTNCIYYLANPDTKRVYIGEAIQLLNRVEVRRINEKDCLVHKNQRDLDNYEFTEYRIDQITPQAYARMLHSFQDGMIGGCDALAKMFPDGYMLTNTAYNQAHNKRREQ